MCTINKKIKKHNSFNIKQLREYLYVVDINERWAALTEIYDVMASLIKIDGDYAEWIKDLSLQLPNIRPCLDQYV